MKIPGVTGIYLAAGSSRRMGTDKLSLPLHHKPLGCFALEAALKSQLDHIILVTKESDGLEWVSPRAFANPWRERWTHIACSESNKGQSYSLKCGLRYAEKIKADAVMILLADQPFISVESINTLICYYHQEKKKKPELQAAAASYQGVFRPPIIFSREIFPVLMQLQGDAGARQLWHQDHSVVAAMLEFNDEKIFLDIDTKEDYERIEGGNIS
ncbi:NTP transferase domain-containing protein [Bacillus sp. 165]|uniref:NTP transferase domain-containing protein n=1 Tax=Bacillus sp. 165 TaxID=1529117 RepID=UPI001ADCB64A|nr:NTP transferase domain-containing protein [Bacillus sp. 165]MBO9131038.1 NTP transferase domain-containing protein [Bacillus sp. 165]